MKFFKGEKKMFKVGDFVTHEFMLEAGEPLQQFMQIHEVIEQECHGGKQVFYMGYVWGFSQREGNKSPSCGMTREMFRWPNLGLVKIDPAKEVIKVMSRKPDDVRHPQP